MNGARILSFASATPFSVISIGLSQFCLIDLSISYNPCGYISQPKSFTSGGLGVFLCYCCY